MKDRFEYFDEEEKELMESVERGEWNQSVHVHFDNSVREMRVGGNVESSTLNAGDENEMII